ncbi:MAG: DUF3108 domain-containing protein [Sphingobacteriales bacterium]|nr:MAG: DUF3108 domain-containing protein [Sphingobacteriales bacterium]
MGQIKSSAHQSIFSSNHIWKIRKFVQPIYQIVTFISLITSLLLPVLPQQAGSPADSPKIDYVAYQPGEFLKYDLNYNGISGGVSTFQIKNETKAIAGKPHFQVSITGKSFPVVDAFYKVRDYYESYIDVETLLPTVYIRDVTEGKYVKKEYYIFDQKDRQIIANKQTYKVQTDMHDIVSAFYYLRCIDFSNKPIGYTLNLNAFFDEEVFPLGVQYRGKTIINSSVGKINCMIFKPKLIEGRVFQDQEDMTIYVSDDKNQVPVRIESKVYLGRVRAELVKYSGLKFPFTAKIPG